MQADEMRPFYIPMGLLCLQSEIKNIGELPVKQFDYRTASFLREVNFASVKCRFHSLSFLCVPRVQICEDGQILNTPGSFVWVHRIEIRNLGSSPSKPLPGISS